MVDISIRKRFFDYPLINRLFYLNPTHSLLTKENVSPNEQSSPNLFTNLQASGAAGGGFPGFPSQFGPGADNNKNNNNNRGSKTFGAPFGKSPSVIGPQNRPGKPTQSLDPDVEVFSEV